MAASAGSSQGAEADCWSRVPEKNFPTRASLKGSKPQRPGRCAFLCTLTSLSDASGAIWAWLWRMKESIIKVTGATWSCNQTPGLGTHKLCGGNTTSCRSWNYMCWWVGGLHCQKLWEPCPREAVGIRNACSCAIPPLATIFKTFPRKTLPVM